MQSTHRVGAKTSDSLSSVCDGFCVYAMWASFRCWQQLKGRSQMRVFGCNPTSRDLGATSGLGIYFIDGYNRTQ